MFAGLELTPTVTRWDGATSPTEGRAQPIGMRSGDGAAVAAGDTLAVDFRDTPSRRAGRTTTTSAPAGACRVVYVAARRAP